MNEVEQLTSDLDRAIESLAHVKTKAPAILACPDDARLARVTKACGAVSDLRDWAEKQPDPVETEEVEQEAVEIVPAVAKEQEAEPEEETSEVADLLVPDAADKISRMKSVEKLQHIAATDKRHGVISAANKRLEELSSQE